MRLLRKIIKWTVIGIILLLLIYILGPIDRYLPIDASPVTYDIPLQDLDSYIEDKEGEVTDLKPDNHARIIWVDSLKQKTTFAIVYLHGFSASQEEGDPIHTEFAKRYGMNLYLPRLFDHGRYSKETFRNLTPADLVNSAREAVAIGRLLGEKVILMSCSTGGTLSAILATEDADIHSLIMYSPNIDLADPTSDLIVRPWGRQILKLVMGGEYNHIQYSEDAKQYWSETYHIDGIIALKSLISKHMNEALFAQIKVPVFLGYYYKNVENQDDIVSVARMLDFYDQLGSTDDMKRSVAFPKAERHVISSYIFSKDIDGVMWETFLFVEQVLGIRPVSKN